MGYDAGSQGILLGAVSNCSPKIMKATFLNENKERQFQDVSERFVAEAKRPAKFQNEPGVEIVWFLNGNNGFYFLLIFGKMHY